uniref:Uncharacterized protein n=1 Tax=Kalanchoe fedtschenkoi TaxID=63787 RepID=A0A7N0V8I8_KALFE
MKYLQVHQSLFSYLSSSDSLSMLSIANFISFTFFLICCWFHEIVEYETLQTLIDIPQNFHIDICLREDL